jgi:hypothetical protein
MNGMKVEKLSGQEVPFLSGTSSLITALTTPATEPFFNQSD